MTKKVLLIGSNGGIGSTLLKLMSNSDKYDVTGWTSEDLDLNYPERIFDCDFSNFDILINCAGHSQGTYLGFLNNSWQNQLSQITVNYTSNLFLLKHYATSQTTGKYVWISTSLLYNGSRPFHSIYVGSKQASKTAIDLIRSEATHINILEVNVGPTKTGFRYRNFEGTKTNDEVEVTYGDAKYLPILEVAQGILTGIEEHKTEILIK